MKRNLEFTMRFNLLLKFLLPVLFCSASNLAGQAATISGKVVNSNGIAIAEAKVVVAATNSAGMQFIHEASTDESGAYQVELTSACQRVQAMAFKEGYGIAAAPMIRGNWRARALLEGKVKAEPIVLFKAKPIELRIVSPEGEPVTARLTLTAVSGPDNTNFYVTDKGSITKETLQLETKADGTLFFDLQPADGGVVLSAETADYGTQPIMLSHQHMAESITYKLNPVASLAVKLEGTNRKSGREISVSVRTQPPSSVVNGVSTRPKELSPTYFESRAKTNEEGVAEITVMAGKATLYVIPSASDVDFAEASGDPISLQPNSTVEHTLRFVPGIHVTGRIIDPNEHPVAGVEVYAGTARSTTNDEGRYELHLPPRRSWIRIESVPDGYVVTDEHLNFQIKSEPSNQELPDAYVETATSVSGIVANTQGQPVENAKVVASWVQKSRTNESFTLRTDSTNTDGEGRFRLSRVAAGNDMTVTVETDTMATLPRSISASHTELLNVVVSSDNMTKLRGVLQDADGHPIRDAKIKVKRSIGTNRNWGERIVRFDGQESFNANEKGEFVTPKLLPRYAKYILTCEAPAFLAKSTSYVMAPERGDLDLGVIELIRSRTITGQVVNSKGEPIGGVEVKAWSADKDQSRGASTRVAATTDDQGKFQLANIHPQAALATLKKDGFRQSGFSLVRPDTVTKARMYRLDEQIREPDRVVLNRLTERHRSAALTLIEKLAPTRRNSNYFHKILIDMMAKVDRELLTKELAKTNKASSRSLILAELGEFEDALAELEEIENGYRRGFSRFAVLDRIDDADLVADVLANAAIDAESVLQPDRRLAVVAHVAERLYAAGDVDTARKILFDQRELAGSLSPKDWPGFARASFAERLALFDLDTALKMIAEMDAKDHSRHYQNIAHMIAERNPKGAIKALKCIEKNRSIGSPTIRVGYRMAKSKLENALQLESMIDTNRFNVGKSQLLGVISYSIKEENPDKSKELLSRAFTDLPGRGHNMGYQSEMLFGAGLALLRYAEEIAPENLDQHFWQAYETYQGPSGNSWSAGDRTEVDADRQARLAILLWLYGFEELAKQSAASAFEYWENKIKQADEKSYRFRDRQASFVAMALTNPARAVDFAVQCDETLSKEMLRRIPQPWEVIGQSLTMERWDLGQMLSKELFHLWTIDNYDL